MNLKELREQNGISQTKLGNYLGVTRATICRYEANERMPDLETLKNIADYFGVTVDYLLGRTDNPQFTNTAPETVTGDEYDLLQNYRELDDEGKKMVSALAEKLCEMMKPKK